MQPHQPDLLLNREGQYCSLPLPVLRDISDLEVEGPADRANSYFAVIRQNTDSIRASDTKKCLHDFTASSTHQPIDPKNLSLANSQCDIGRLVLPPQPVESEGLRTGSRRAGWKPLIDRPADHEPDQLVPGSFGHKSAADCRPISAYDVAVCNCADLVKLVADVQYGVTVVSQATHDPQEVVSFVLSQGGCELVHDHDTRVVAEHARN